MYTSAKISTVMWLWANIEHHEETVSKHKYLRLKSWVFQNISKEFLSAASKNQEKFKVTLQIAFGEEGRRTKS